AGVAGAYGPHHRRLEAGFRHYRRDVDLCVLCPRPQGRRRQSSRHRAAGRPDQRPQFRPRRAADARARSHRRRPGGDRAPAAAPPTFEPEFIDAFEVGTKNTLLGGGLVLNASAFYYAYEEYQVSKIVDRSAANENFDAAIWGAELEWIFSPTRNLRFNGAFGY